MSESVELPPLASQMLGVVSGAFSPDGLAGPEWIVSMCLRLEGRLDPELLNRSLGALAHRHELLRATLVTGQGRPRVRIADEVPVDMTVRPVSSGVGDPEGWALEHVHQEARRAVDPEVAPTWRVRVVALSPTDHLLSFVAHHLFVDGWSLELVAHDLIALYNREGGDAAPLGPASSYREYAATRLAAAPPSIGAWFESEMAPLPAMTTPEVQVDAGDRVFSAALTEGTLVRAGLRVLASRPVRTLLVRRLVDRGPVRSDSPGRRRPPPERVRPTPRVTEPASFGAAGTAELRARGRRLGTSEAVVLGAVLLRSLRRTFGHDEVWAWSLSSGRMAAEELELVGNFPDIFPIRSVVGDDVPFEATVADVRGAFVRFYTSGGFCAPWVEPDTALVGLLTEVPTGDLARAVATLVDPRRLRVFYDVSPRSAVAEVTGSTVGPGRVDPGATRRLTWRHQEIPTGISRNPADCQLGVRFVDEGDALTFTVQYDARRLGDQVVAGFVRHLTESVAALADTGSGSD